MLAVATYQLGLQRFATSIAEFGIIREFSLAVGALHKESSSRAVLAFTVYDLRLAVSSMADVTMKTQTSRCLCSGNKF
jgi:hypothetical protein